VVQRTLEDALSKALQGEVRFGEFDIDWVRLEARFRDARIDAVTSSGNRGAAAIESGRLRLTWTALPALLTGTIRISSVVVSRPSLSVSRDFLSEWRPRKGRDSRLEVRLDHLAVSDGTISWEGDGPDSRVEIRGLGIRAAWSSSRRALVGDFGARIGIDADGLAKRLEGTSQGAFLYRTGSLELPTVRLAARGISLEGEASTIFGGQGAAWSAAAVVRGDLALIREWFPEGKVPIRGAATATLRMERQPGEEFRLSGSGVLLETRIGRVEIRRASVELDVFPNRIDFARVRGEVLGGEVEGEASLTFRPERVLSAQLQFRDFPARGIVELTGRDLPLASELEGTAEVRMPWEGSESWRGSIAWEAVGRGDPDGVPVSGKGILRLQGGRIRGKNLEASIPGVAVKGDIDVPLSRSPDVGRVDLQGTIDDAEALSRSILTIAESARLDLPDWVDEPIAGRGEIEGFLEFRAGSPVERWGARLNLDGATWRQEGFDSVTVEAEQSGNVVLVPRFELRRGVEGVQGSARVSVAPFSIDRLDFEAAGIRTGPLLARWPSLAGVDGYLSADLSLSGGNHGLDGSGRFRLEGGTLWGEPFRLAQGEIGVRAGDWTLTEGILDGGFGRFDVSGTWSVVDEAASGTLEFHDVAPGLLRRVRESAVVLEGQWGGSGSWRWTRESGPWASLDVHASGLGLGGVAEGDILGSAQGRVAIEGDTVSVSLQRSGNSTWGFDGSMNITKGLPFRGSLVVNRLTAMVPGTAEAVTVDLSGSISAEGSLSEWRQMRAEGNFESLKIYIPGGRIESLQPIPLTLSEGRAELGAARFGTRGAELEALARWNTLTGEVSGSFRGVADLALLSLLRKNLRGSGRLDLDVRLDGTVSAPRIEGRATVTDGRVRWLGLRQSLDEVQAEVVFEGRTARLKAFRALTGGGELNGEGTLKVSLDEDLEFQTKVGVSQVSVEFPAGFRGVYDGALQFEGTLASSALSGRLTLIRGLYDRDFELGGLSAGARREMEKDALAQLPAGGKLDVEIDGADNVWMRNNSGRLEAGVSLRVGGELRRPRIFGRIGLFEGGRLRFRDVDYRLISGSLEFEGGAAIDPFLEVRAETRVQDYDIRLRIAGTFDSFEYELSSYPSLPEADIIYLLLTGQVPATSATAGGTGGTSATGGLAADYFAGVLTAGFTRQVEKTLRIDQFRINPLLEGGTDPTARVTLGKQVTDRLRILYSIDVGTTESDRYFVEWEASRRWRLTAESDWGQVYVGTAQFTDRYGRESPREHDRSPIPAVERAQTSFRIEELVISGPDPGQESLLRSKVKLESGDVVGRAEVFVAADNLRRELVKRGFVQARVATEVIPVSTPREEEATLPVRLVFQVDGGLKTEVVIRGLSGRTEKASRKSLEEFFLDGLTGADLVEEAEGVILEELRGRGRYAAEVVGAVTSSESGERRLEISVDAGPVVEVSEVRVEGVSQLDEQRVRRQILTGRTEGITSKPLQPQVLEEDTSAVATLYRSEGFLDVEVEEPRVRLGLEGNKAIVTFVVREGDRYVIQGVEAHVEGPVDESDVENWSELHPGQPASTSAMAAGSRRVAEELDRRGFGAARVEASTHREDGKVAVKMRVWTGPRMLYVGTTIRGNFRTRDKVILREDPFLPGDPISESKIREYQHRLYRLGVFRSVEIAPAAAPEEEGEGYRLVVTVEEAKPVSFNMGLGYNSEAGPQVSLGVGHDNLWGYNRSLSFQTRWSSLERRIQLVGREPWLFNRRLDSTATYFWEELEEPGYEIRRNSLAFRVERRLPSAWSRFVRYNYQKVDIEIFDPTDNVLAAIREQKLEDLRLGDVGLSFVRDTRDDSFLPTRGGYLLGEVRVFAPVFLSEESFVKTFVQGSTTHTFSSKLAYSLAVRIGAAKTYGSTESVPLSERYFAGGSSTLRGFERDSVGLVVDGVPLGGEAMLVINQELRWPIWGSLALVTFTDWGNVYTELESFDPTDLRYTAGTGIRLDTPIGPLRFEYGWKLDRGEGESGGEFYFAVGSIY
jgi:outer membrane protein assembly complex protein YaeT